MRTRDAKKEQKLREKALDAIVREGVDGLGMQKLAKAAGISPATIYIYFRDRDDLIMTLYREASHQMAEATLMGFDPAMSFAEGLRVQWNNRARYCVSHPREMHFLEQMRHSPYHTRDNPAHDVFIAAMRAFCEGAIRRGELIRIPVEVYWSVAFAPLYQLVKFHMNGRGLPGTRHFVLDDALMSQTLDLVVKALTPAAKARS